MADDKRPKKKRAPKKPPPGAGETQEYSLGDDFLADLGGDDPEKTEVREPEQAPKAKPKQQKRAASKAKAKSKPKASKKPPPPPPAGDADEDAPELFDHEDHLTGEHAAVVPEQNTEEAELEELINAETQEWDGVDPADDYDEDLDAEADHDDAEKTLVARASATITSGFEAVGKGATSGFKVVKEKARFPMWARFLTAGLVIVASVGTATATSLLLYIEDIGADIKPLPGVAEELERVEGGQPQTIMILGSDNRPQDGQNGLSDTTMLLRVDPDKNALALFSLPRDLRVNIPGYGIDKLNAAYALGGPELTLKTVRELTKTPATPDGLEINHIVNINFEGFARAVNALDCVYIDVDRRYFNTNDASLSAADDYEEIDIQPGYQALCGFDALDYARYRHTDNDVIRAARQQDFLREARQKVPPEVLFAERQELISIFTEHTSSDIRDVDDMLQVLKLFIEARDAPLKQVKFEGTLGPSFVDTTPEEINRAVEQFLGLEDSPGARADSAVPEDPSRVGDEAPDASGQADATKEKDKGGGGSDNQIVESTFGKELAKGIRARKVKLPIYYPTRLESGTDYAQKPRVYKINGTGEGSPPNSERAAYKWVFSRPTLGEYYGFMATRWRDPPILNNPDDEREIGNRTYKLFFDGDRLRMIAWQDDEGSYWVTNTLAQSLSDDEMVEIARGMTELPRRGGN